MAWSDKLDNDFLRLRAILLLMVGAFAFLGTVLWRVQVLNTSEYSSSLYRQSIRRVRLPASRGAIYDRNGICLADNRPSHCLGIYVEELKQPGRWENTVDEVERIITRLSGILGLRREVSRKDIRKHIRLRLPLPLPAWRDIDYRALARWAESSVRLPGVDIYVEPVRAYPWGPLAAHLLGYVGRAPPPSDDEPYHFYLPEMAGRYGIEQTMNDTLTGVAGGRLIRVDAAGFRHDEMAELPPRPGKDVMLTLDLRIQRLAESVLTNETGAAVVLDPRNGDVLAMASSPSFDPSRLRERSLFRRLNVDPGKPLFNRAAMGEYPPGSTFKPVVAIAALENRRANARTTFRCPGYFALGKTRFHCWRKSGHGEMDVRKALEQSCNAHFCQLGLTCGYARIYHMSEALGIGRRTGIDLGSESGGLLPDNTWKMQKYRDAWRSGDTCNVSIGQGALLVTPLQMAVLTATIANGGHVYRPRLRFTPGEKGILINNMRWSRRTLETVRGGMHDVIHSQQGTGKRARVEGVEMAGKTGSAEYGAKAERRTHAWMIAFAPFGAPRYVVAIVIENGVSGGVTAAPRIGELMKGMFELEAATTRRRRLEGAG